jgi:protein-S-isoprenylcysteine O-methyltransferase Ste14
MLLLAAACMWALDRWLPLSSLIAPPWNQLGALPFALGLGIGIASVVIFRRAGTTVSPLNPSKASRLVTAGTFRISRNPMYLGVYCTLLATVLRTMNPVLPLVAAFIIAVHNRIVVAEETHLRNAFGKEYGEYCSRVRRYL